MPSLPPSYNPRGTARERKQRYDKERGTRTERKYDNRWLRAARLYLMGHPLCAECERQGRVKAAYQVDHIIPHKGDDGLFWDEGNWQGLCAECGARKSGQGQ